MMSNSIDGSSTSHALVEAKIDHNLDIEHKKNLSLIQSTGSFADKLEHEFQKVEKDFKQLEGRAEDFMKNHKALPALLKELDELKDEDPKDFTPAQKKDIETLKSCFETLQECSKILAATKIYINKLKALMDAIANDLIGSTQLKFPKLDLEHVPKKMYQLTLPKLPDIPA